MNKLTSIIRYEYIMQLRRPAAWGILLAATALAQFDCFPSSRNLARLEFLNQPAYFIHRIMTFDVLLLMFGLSFLLAARFPGDRRLGVNALFLAAPLKKGQYVWGKLAGGLLFTVSFLSFFLMINTFIYCMGAPFPLPILDCLVPLGKALALWGLPICLFVAFGSVGVASLLDLRLFYLLEALFFGYNAAYVGSADVMPWYLLTLGDLGRLIWVHPRWPAIDRGSVLANGLFLAGSALVFAILPLFSRRLWRPKTPLKGRE